MATAADRNDSHFYASPDRRHFEWLHPLEQPIYHPDYIDVTDLDDAEFESFVRGA